VSSFIRLPGLSIIAWKRKANLFSDKIAEMALKRALLVPGYGD